MLFSFTKKKILPVVEISRSKTWHFEMHQDRCTLSKWWFLGPKFLQLATSHQEKQEKKTNHDTYIYYGQDHVRIDKHAFNGDQCWFNNLIKSSNKIAQSLTTRVSGAVQAE
jgi:hypothetical protein